MPGESTAARVHEAPIETACQGRIVGHISRSAAAIEARERSAKVETPRPTKPKLFIPIHRVPVS
ncbi:MAG: hypothetical protein ACREC6_07175, partial [Hyphomicrobiaceae bacterium]